MYFNLYAYDLQEQTCAHLIFIGSVCANKQANVKVKENGVKKLDTFFDASFAFEFPLGL